MKNTAILCNGLSSKKTDRIELIEELRKHNIQPYYGGSYDGEINKYFCKETAIYIPIISSRNNTNPFFELYSIYSIKKAIKENDIDSVIIYGVKNHPAMAIGAKLGGARKIMCIVNGSGNLFRVEGFKGWILRCMSFPMLRLAYKLSHIICFQNIDDKLLFLNKRLIRDNKKSIITAGSGVNLMEYKFTPLPDENRFLYLSRITPTKGVIEYIQAAKIVKNKYPDVIFDIVGPIDSKVEKFVEGNLLEDLGNKNQKELSIVNYHGPTDNVQFWMSKCRFFVYPSYYPEGVPRCALQAIASGRPIITCNTVGCKETVEDGVNGFLVAPKNVKELADKMIWMIENPEIVAKMANASRKLAEHKFDVFNINKDLINKMSE